MLPSKVSHFPHNGPSLVDLGGDELILGMTNATDTARQAYSKHSGQNFGATQLVLMKFMIKKVKFKDGY